MNQPFKAAGGFVVWKIKGAILHSESTEGRITRTGFQSSDDFMNADVLQVENNTSAFIKQPLLCFFHDAVTQRQPESNNQ